MKRSEFVTAAAALAALGLASKRATAGQQYQVTHTDAQWRALLGPDRYEILREGGTEPPFSSPLIKQTERGTYRCAGCETSALLLEDQIR